MINTVVDESPQSRIQVARKAAEFVLSDLPTIPIQFNRNGVATALQQAIVCLCSAFDLDKVSRSPALTQAAVLLGSARETLLNSAEQRNLSIDRMASILADACMQVQATGEVITVDRPVSQVDSPRVSSIISTPVEPPRVNTGQPQSGFAPRTVPNKSAVVPEFLCKAQFSKATTGPVRFLSGDAVVAPQPYDSAPRHELVEEPPRVEMNRHHTEPPMPPPVPVVRKPDAAPVTYIDLNSSESTSNLKPLKRLPWET